MAALGKLIEQRFARLVHQNDAEDQRNKDYEKDGDKDEFYIKSHFISG